MNIFFASTYNVVGGGGGGVLRIPSDGDDPQIYHRCHLPLTQITRREYLLSLRKLLKVSNRFALNLCTADHLEIEAEITFTISRIRKAYSTIFSPYQIFRFTEFYWFCDRIGIRCDSSSFRPGYFAPLF